MRRELGLILFCLTLFGAILAGYWDLLDPERLDLHGEQAETTQAGPGIPAPRGGHIPPNRAGAPDPALDGAQTRAVPAAGSRENPPEDESSARFASQAEDTADATAGEGTAVPPSFDIVRVEPDGSTVIAGRAPAGARIEILDNGTVAETGRVNAFGQFAFAFDRPLSLGDHQLRLIARTEAGTTVRSRETAIIHIPESGEERDLLALVEAPNAPSRLISIPQARTPSSETGTAPSEGGESPAIMLAGVEERNEPSFGPGGAGRPDDLLATEEGEAVIGEEMQAAFLPQDPASEAAGIRQALLPAADSAPAGGGIMMQPSSRLAVEAVEIEGERIYIAGTAPQDQTIRVYLDNRLLGETRGKAGDRFLISRRHAVDTGRHTIRADQIGADGTVLLRAEVPFHKPEGTKMAAIALRPGEEGRTPPSAVTDGHLRSPDGAAASGLVSVADGQAGGKAIPAARETRRQPGLARVEGRVIIRPGDTLWHISRETYGSGSRYTVIYAANGDQIRDPDLIYPGQVFHLPAEDGAGGSQAPSAG